MARFVPTTTNIIVPELVALFYENIKLKYRVPYRVVLDYDTRITSKF